MKTDSQSPFVPQHGSLSDQNEPADGSLSCTPLSTLAGTTFYILGGDRRLRSADSITKQSGPADIVAFPLSRRASKVLDVATKLSRVRTHRHETYYRRQVSVALDLSMKRQGIPTDERSSEIASFWRAVSAAISSIPDSPQHRA